MIIKYEKLKEVFYEILIDRGFSKEDAQICANVFADNTLDGIYSHGVNRFKRMIDYIDQKEIDVNNKATVEFESNSFVRMDGKKGFGPLNATIAMNKACELAKKYGIGIVALRNTNHWLRGGTYGKVACDNNMIGICFSNTKNILPPWGGIEAKLGNNPLVIGVPYNNESIVLDLALSQYSWGKVDQYRMNHQKLEYYGGYDENNNLTDDPEKIIKNHRFLPAGLWKGSGLSLLLDILLSTLSLGNSVKDIATFENEVGLSQIFIAINPYIDQEKSIINNIIKGIIDDIHNTTPIDQNKKVMYPSEKEKITKKDNLKNGISVNDDVWNDILKIYNGVKK